VRLGVHSMHSINEDLAQEADQEALRNRQITYKRLVVSRSISAFSKKNSNSETARHSVYYLEMLLHIKCQQQLVNYRRTQWYAYHQLWSIITIIWLRLKWLNVIYLDCDLWHVRPLCASDSATSFIRLWLHSEGNVLVPIQFWSHRCKSTAVVAVMSRLSPVFTTCTVTPLSF